MKEKGNAGAAVSRGLQEDTAIRKPINQGVHFSG